ncbi:hypothetical protein GQ54DRAFT_311725 [Martensiomyces pterosporus]|nr:hypothetical protein GQ54DRAFT_311725 [Martensiomyces pterosporus]
MGGCLSTSTDSADAPPHSNTRYTTASGSGNGGGSGAFLGRRRNHHRVVNQAEGSCSVDFGHNIRWRAEQPMTSSELHRQREAFWDTAPVYEGRAEVWQALRLACESDDRALAPAILESAGISVPTGRLIDGAYDELGACYRIPKYCLCAPVNMVDDNDAGGSNGYTSSSYLLQRERSLRDNESIRALAALAEEVGATGRSSSEEVNRMATRDGHSASPGAKISCEEAQDAAAGGGAGARASVDSGRSMDIRTAVAINASANSTPNPIARVASGTPSFGTAGDRLPGSSYQSPKLPVADSDSISFASSSAPPPAAQHKPPVGGGSALLPVIVRLAAGVDVEVGLAADTTIAQIEHQLRQDGQIPVATPRVRFFYLGHPLNPTVAPVRDMRLSNTVVIQAMYALPA